MGEAMSARRWLPCGTAALALHVAAIVLVREAPVRALPGGPPESPAELAIELAPAEEDAVASPAPPAPEGKAHDLTMDLPSRARLPLEGALAIRELGATPGAPSSEPGPSEPAPAPADSGWTFPAGRPGDVLAPGAVARAVLETVPVVPAPTTVSPTGGLAEGLDARDAALGLGRGGAITSALEAATYADVDAEGRATFDVSIDTSGHVSVSLLDASTAAPAWTHVAQAMRASLDAGQVRVPPGAHGWHVVATVESKIVYPNGADPKKMGTKLEADGPALTTNEHRTTVGDAPIVFKKMPGVTLAHSGKVCSVRIHLGLGPPISGGCDPTNIGAHTTRVVHTHVVREGRL
jgi:hypothetical protein